LRLTLLSVALTATALAHDLRGYRIVDIGFLPPPQPPGVSALSVNNRGHVTGRGPASGARALAASNEVAAIAALESFIGRVRSEPPKRIPKWLVGELLRDAEDVAEILSSWQRPAP
jgi:hypothetical protein